MSISWINTLNDVVAKNSAANSLISDVIGNKTDNELGNSIYAQNYLVNKHFHTRSETYPYLAAAIGLTGGSGAWVLGSKVEIIPTATSDIQTLTITHAADANGNINLFLDDIKFVVPVIIGDTASVATQIRAFSFIDPLTGDTYITGGAGNDVTLTRLGRREIARFIDVGTTGVTMTIVHTTPGVGVGDYFDIHFITTSAADANTTYQIVLWKGLSGYEERISTKRLIRVALTDSVQPCAMISPKLEAGTRVSASLATLAGGTDHISMALEYHIY